MAANYRRTASGASWGQSGSSWRRSVSPGVAPDAPATLPAHRLHRSAQKETLMLKHHARHLAVTAAAVAVTAATITVTGAGASASTAHPGRAVAAAAAARAPLPQ